MFEERISSSNGGWGRHRVAALLPNQRISNMQLSAVQHEGLVTFTIRRSLFLVANSFFYDWFRSSDTSRSSTSIIDYAACSPVANIVRTLGIIRNLKEGSKSFLGGLHCSCFPNRKRPYCRQLAAAHADCPPYLPPRSPLLIPKSGLPVKIRMITSIRCLPHGQFWALYWVFNMKNWRDESRTFPYKHKGWIHVTDGATAWSAGNRN
jgi:hypothetical protein